MTCIVTTMCDDRKSLWLLRSYDLPRSAAKAATQKEEASTQKEGSAWWIVRWFIVHPSRMRTRVRAGRERAAGPGPPCSTHPTVKNAGWVSRQPCSESILVYGSLAKGEILTRLRLSVARQMGLGFIVLLGLALTVASSAGQLAGGPMAQGGRFEDGSQPSTLRFISWDPPAAYPRTRYHTRMSVLGGVWPYRFEFVRAAKDAAISADRGEVAWIPARAGPAVEFEVRATDSADNSVSKRWTVTP